MLAGDRRRGCEFVGNVVVVTTASPGEPIPGARVIAGVADDRSSVLLWRATGPAAHVAAVTARAQSLGVDWDGIVGADEDERVVDDTLELAYVAPEQRDAVKFLAEKGRARPKLVALRGLQGALHNHTTAWDGADSSAALPKGARARVLRSHPVGHRERHPEGRSARLR